MLTSETPRGAHRWTWPGKKETPISSHFSKQTADLGPLAEPVDAALRRLRAASAVEQLWGREGALWSGDSEVAGRIERRLGWLDLPSPEAALATVARAAELVRLELDRDSRGRRIILLGMGGSSLAPEVMDQALPRRAIPFTVLDSTSPGAIRAVEADGLDGAVFIVSSKSGGTIETRTLAAHFLHRAPDAAFLAITDEGTALSREAAAPPFCGVIHNDPDIGGRYSALSHFGLVPAGLCGVDVRSLLARAAAMAEACRSTSPKDNPGAVLGATLGAAAGAGRDKVTLILSPALAALGAWIEQLLAESTGKNGRGLLPVDGETAGTPDEHGPDRLFVHVALASARGRGDYEITRLARAGHPVVRLTLTDPEDLGAEFVRWEVATALAGFLMGINPFDEPNVQQSKDVTEDLLAAYRRDGRFPERPPTLEESGIALYGDGGAAPAGGIGGVIESFLHGTAPPAYVALLAFLPRTPAAVQALTAMRKAVREHFQVATTAGFGPRYLHSTGQYFKGGPPHGRFLIFTADEDADLVIPGEDYTFGTLLRAQALGDVQALRAGGRRVLGVHLREASGLETVAAILREAVGQQG
jgi:glucose-6-phosphate isomerase